MEEPDATVQPPYWCHVCGKDLQSAVSFQGHITGHKHLQRAARVGMTAGARELRPRGHSRLLPQLSEEEFTESLTSGKYRRVVILTGAGVSTSAGIPDFRSPGGLYEQIRSRFGPRFAKVNAEPEWLLSREFASLFPEVWAEEVRPWTRARVQADAQPTPTHRFCAWLHHQGWLCRIYTQNVDGLHRHPSLEIPDNLVVECHGSLLDGNVVLYNDALPDCVRECCDADFPQVPAAGAAVDLVIVFGTSLQVAPFCGIPNLAPAGCARVLVNLNIQDCLVNNWSKQPRTDSSSMVQAHSARIGDRVVSLRPKWTDRKSGRRWRQLLIEGKCDDAVRRFVPALAAEEERS